MKLMAGILILLYMGCDMVEYGNVEDRPCGRGCEQVDTTTKEVPR